MDTKKQWSLVTVAVCAVIVLAGYFLLIAPTHKHVDSLHTQADTATTQTASLRSQLALLTSEKADLPAQQAQLAAIEQKLPSGPDLPGLITGLDAVGAAAGLDLVDVAPGTPSAVTGVSAATPVAGTSAAATTGTAATTATTPTTTNGLTGVAQIPVAITAKGTYFQLENFLSKLETYNRGLLVDNFTLAPGGTGTTASSKAGADTLTLNGRVFMATTPLGAATSTAK